MFYQNAIDKEQNKEIFHSGGYISNNIFCVNHG